MGAAINVVYLTTDDPLYLPAFFERVLSARADTAAVFVVPPLYRNQSARAAAWRYFRTFGAMASVSLAAAFGISLASVAVLELFIAFLPRLGRS